MISRLLLYLCFVPHWFSIGGPQPRHLEEVIYDESRKVIILFGGAEISSNSFSEPTSIFEWDGAKWKESNGTGPTGRRGHGFIYDPGQKLTFLFGGVTSGHLKEDSVLSDVWTWNGKT